MSNKKISIYFSGQADPFSKSSSIVLSKYGAKGANLGNLKLSAGTEVEDPFSGSGTKVKVYTAIYNGPLVKSVLKLECRDVK